MKANATADFLRFLSDGFPDDAFIEVRRRAPSGRIAQHFLLIGELKQRGWDPELPAAADEDDVWVGVNPRVQGGDGEVKGDRAHVPAVRLLWADLDKGLPEKWPVTVPHPTMLVESSEGKRQAYWRLSEETRDIERVSRLVNALAELLGGDRVGDAPRVQRLPGYHNQKYPTRPPVKLLWGKEERTYTLDQFPPARERPSSADQPKKEVTPTGRAATPLKAGFILSEQERGDLLNALVFRGHRLTGDHTRGACVFPHDPPAGDPSHLWVDLQDGHWTCFSQSHLPGVGKPAAGGTAYSGSTRDFRMVGLLPILPGNSKGYLPPVSDGPETAAEVDSWALRLSRKHLMESQLLAEGTELGLSFFGASKAQLRTFTSQLATQPTFTDLEPRIAPWLETKSLKLTQQLRDCGVFKGKFCSDHGLRHTPTPFNCRAGWEAGCLTRVGERLGAALIADMKPEEGSLRVLLFQSPFELPKKLNNETPAEWAEAVKGVLENEITAFTDAVARVSNRKRFRGGLWARVFQQTLMRRGNYWWGWVAYEQKPGGATGEDLAKALLGILSDAKLMFAGSLQSGDEIAMLLMLLTRSWLLDFDHDNFAFEGAVNAHAHHAMFQSYGGLQKALDEQEAKEEEEKAGRKPFEKEAPYGRCEVKENGKTCGKALFQASVPTGQEHSLKLGDKPGWALGRWAAVAAPPPAKAPAGTQGRF